MHLILATHLIGKSNKCQNLHFIEETDTQKVNDLSAVSSPPSGKAKPRCFCSAPFSLTCTPCLTGRCRTTVVHKHGCGFPRWPLNKRSGYKQAKLCREFFSVRTAYIATHVQEVSGLSKYFKINISQRENELLTQVTYLRLQ